MLHRGSPFRLFVTLLLALAVPFCCCNFHSWLSVCVSCEVGTQPSVVEPRVHHHSDGAAHDHELDHHADHTTNSLESECESSPCGPGHDDDHDCICGKQKTLMAVAKTTVELPVPMLVAILPLPVDFYTDAFGQFWARVRNLSGVPRPAATLLRLHCALIV